MTLLQIPLSNEGSGKLLVGRGQENYYEWIYEWERRKEGRRVQPGIKHGCHVCAAATTYTTVGRWTDITSDLAPLS